MKKSVILFFLAIFASFALFAQGPITGTMGTCIGSISHLSADSLSSGGGTWSSSNTAIATVTPATSYSAYVTGVSAGIATITYTLGGAYVTASYTVSPAPAVITGTPPTCIGITATLSDATPGGVWSSSTPWVATVSPAGIVTSVGGGYTDILYTISTGCYASVSVSIPTSFIGDSIMVPSGVCVGSSIIVTDTPAGGTWSIASTAIATISSSGVVTGVSAGTTNITYTISSSCSGTVFAVHPITVSSTTVTGTISGPSSVSIGADITLSDWVPGSVGTWSSTNTSVATINPSTGILTGIGTGTTTISYAVTGCTGLAAATTNVTVTALDGISGHVLFGSGGYFGSARVWLISYNPATLNLEAIDSATIYTSGSTGVYYQFTGLSTDSFRVKATVSFDTSYAATGFVPTYHNSSYYWHDANVIYHTSGTADINENINMAVGSATPGPGFIGGSVTTGANKSTSGTTAPVAGLLIYAVNATTNTLIQQTYTNSAGNYTFSDLPYGTYFVYPELINYTTIPYTSITLNTAGATKTGASFIQHTVSHTITPGDAAVANTQSAASYLFAFPNPASGKLNIVWTETTNETGNVSITDVTGREVYKTAIKMNAGSGMGQVDLSALTNGLYIITVKSANIDYNNKIQVQH